MDSPVPDYDASVEKYCSGCEEVHPLTEFHRDRTHKDGYKSWCRTCRSGKKRPGAPGNSLNAEHAGKTKEELEKLARAMAIKRCLENHWSEFEGLIRRYRGEVGLPREWHEVQT